MKTNRIGRQRQIPSEVTITVAFFYFILVVDYSVELYYIMFS